MKLVDVAIAAKKLSVSERTVYRMLEDRASPLQGVRVYKSAIRVIYDSIDMCLKPICKDYEDNSAKQGKVDAAM